MRPFHFPLQMDFEYGFIYCFNEQLCAKCTKSVKTAVGILLDNSLSRKPKENESFSLESCRLWHHVTTNMHIIKSNLSQIHVGKIVFVFLAKKKKSVTLLSSHTRGQTGMVHRFFCMNKTPLKNWQDTSQLGANLLFMNREQLCKKIRFVAFVVT